MYDTVNVTGNVTVNANITIAEGQTLNVTGDVDVENNFELTVDGMLTVGGTLTVGGGASGTLNGDGVVTVGDATRNGTGASVASSLDITITNGTYLVANLAMIAQEGTEITLNKGITTNAANQFYYGADAASAVSIPSGDVATAGTYVKNGNGWLLTGTVDSITFTTAGINDAAVKAAFENTDNVVLDKQPTGTITIPSGKTVVMNGSLPAEVNVQGTLELNSANAAFDLRKINGIGDKATVIFGDSVAKDPSNSGKFYSSKGISVVSYLDLQGETFVNTADANGNGDAGFLAQP